jgi:hypothetical protein
VGTIADLVVAKFQDSKKAVVAKATKAPMKPKVTNKTKKGKKK